MTRIVPTLQVWSGYYGYHGYSSYRVTRVTDINITVTLLIRRGVEICEFTELKIHSLLGYFIDRVDLQV